MENQRINYTKDYLLKHNEAFREMYIRLDDSKRTLHKNFNTTVDCLLNCLRNGNKVLIAGNGGSAADAQHMAAELVGKFLKQRKALPAIALNTNSSSVTAIANDFGYNDSFSRQVEAFGKPQDVLISFSTSGESENIIQAILTANEIGLTTISFTGSLDSDTKEFSRITLQVPSEFTPIIQEMHIILYHLICGIVENELYQAS